MSRLVSRSSAAYRALLWVCPADLRKDFGLEMQLVFEEELEDSMLTTGTLGAIRVWRRAARELFVIGVCNAARTPDVIVPAAACVFSALGLGGEMMLARANASAAGIQVSISEVIATVVVLPSLIAAVVAFLAVRFCARAATPHNLLSMDKPVKDS